MVDVLRLRGRVLKHIRDFFYSKGFLEVETPILVPYENPDLNVKNVEVNFSDFSGRSHNWFLHTSPELFMKRVVHSGVERCFQICRVFRDGEVTDHHSVEFTMVEWYRVGADFRGGMEETEELVKSSFEAAGRRFATFRGRSADVVRDFERVKVEDAFREFAGVDIFDREEVVKVSGSKSYSEGFFKLLVENVEPSIAAFGRGVFLYGYPEEFSALSMVKDGVAERFELYICGLELSNGYTELTSASDYRSAFERKGGRALDEGFLNLLEVSDLPECEGVSLGFDRLVMLITGMDINSVSPFSTYNLIRGSTVQKARGLSQGKG